jgi:ABC-type phosphate/phosphonate transport system substrate-binding protein
VLLAAPVPALARCAGGPVYWTDIVVRTDSPLQEFTAAFGRRFAYTTPDSQSGYQGPRALFAPHVARYGAKLFATTIGPLVTPSRVIDAVIARECDAGPLDCYYHALLRVTEPDLAARLRVIATTATVPIPPLVAAPTLAPRSAERLTQALLAVAEAAELAPLRARLCLERFVDVDAARYDELVARARAADATGYTELR